MQEFSEQHYDALAKKMMKATKLESPSSNFTANLMSKLEGTSEKKLGYQLLISKRVWALITIIALGFIGYLVFGNGESLGWFEGMNFEVIEGNKISEFFSGIKISKTILYTVVSFGILMLIQVTTLKNYFDKRLTT